MSHRATRTAALLLIALPALAAAAEFLPFFPTPRGYVDVNQIRTMELITGNAVLVNVQGDTLVAQAEQKAAIIALTLELASEHYPGYWIQTKPTRVINLGATFAGWYLNPDILLIWSNGDRETLTGQEADSLLAHPELLQGFGE